MMHWLFLTDLQLRYPREPTIDCITPIVRTRFIVLQKTISISTKPTSIPKKRIRDDAESVSCCSCPSIRLGLCTLMAFIAIVAGIIHKRLETI